VRRDLRAGLELGQDLRRELLAELGELAAIRADGVRRDRLPAQRQ